MSRTQKAVLFTAIGLFGIWMSLHIHRLAFSQNGLIRIVLGVLFSFLIVIRPKGTDHQTTRPPDHSAGLALAGTVLYLIGVVLDIANAEWIGLLLLLLTCLRWALPQAYRRDILLGMLLLYWVHPLPGQVFGPFQLFMQRASTQGSEWFLHMINVRAWADGLVLRTGENVYEIPQWCSGMRTATTVFLLTLGLGLLKRLRWWMLPIAAGLALIQALILNVIRIVAMVLLVPSLKGITGTDFLHDSTWIIVIAGVFLVYLEIVFWDRYRRERATQKADLSPEIKTVLSEYPPFWRFFVLYRSAMIVTVAIGVLGGYCAFKSRPYHRAEMIKSVAERLRDHADLNRAQQAAGSALDLVPDDRTWRVEAIRIMIMRNQFDDALKAMEKVSANTEAEYREKDILAVYCLMGVGRLEEATALVEKLPEDIRTTNPFVAMVVAETGLYANDPDRVAIHIKAAALWPANRRRVRALYPFLRSHRKWSAIATTDVNLPYRRPTEALAAMEAYMNLDQGSRVTEILLQATTRWPTDPRLLEPLFFMALRRQGGKWEDRFANHLIRVLPATEEPDVLNPLFEKCFQLVRPDLGWRLYNRIEELDPTHPALPIAAVRFGHRWFSFRKQFLGVAASDAAEIIDLRIPYRLGIYLPPWQEYCAQVPLAGELLPTPTAPARKRLLQKALAEFERRISPTPQPSPSPSPTQVSGLKFQPSPSMHYDYAHALDIHGDTAGARQVLDRLVEHHPKEAQRARLALSEIYERRGDWYNVYETLRDAPSPSLGALLRLSRAQLMLKMGLAALHTTRVAVDEHPHSPQAHAMLAAVVVEHDSAEEALFILTQPHVPRERATDQLQRQLLYQTQRYMEIQPFCEAAALLNIPIPPDIKQMLFLPPAETATLWHHIAIPSERQFAETAAILKRNLSSAPDAFFAPSMRLWLAAYHASPTQVSGLKSQPSPSPFALSSWEALGRDPIEKATALNQLTLLLCRHERVAEARKAAQRATELFPESPILWRILISLSNADPPVINQAYDLHPLDPEIALAKLVVSTTERPTSSRPKGDGPPRVAGMPRGEAFAKRKLRPAGGRAPGLERCNTEGHQGLATKRSGVATFIQYPTSKGLLLEPANHSPATLTRAADYLFRKDQKTEAARLMRSATDRARGLLPAYFLGIKCALSESDRDWAVTCTRQAIRASRQPLPVLHKQMVQLKLTDNAIATDTDTLSALRILRSKEPDNPAWAQMLGYVRFERGGYEIVDALYQMTAAIDAGATNRTSYLVAAEAARRLDNHDRAADILRKARTHHPADVPILNNLLYTLATTPTDLTDNTNEVATVLSELRLKGGDEPPVLDTVAIAYLYANQVELAQATIVTLLKLVEKGSVPWFHAMTHLADIALRQDDPDRAVKTLEEVFRHSDKVRDEDLLRANRFMEKAKEKIAERDRKKTVDGR